MDKIVDETAPSGESKAHTAAYASFDCNTASLLHAFQFITRGIQGLKYDLESELAPEAMSIARQIKQLGRVQDKEASNQKAGSTEEIRSNLIQKLSDTLLTPIQQFTDGFLTVREWIPVLTVTIVETYLKDVLIYAASVDPAIMESSEQPPPSASYAEVIRAGSFENLKKELRSEWARKFVDKGGPTRWIERLDRNGRTWVSSRNR